MAEAEQLGVSWLRERWALIAAGLAVLVLVALGLVWWLKPAGHVTTYRANQLPVAGRILLPTIKGSGPRRTAVFSVPASWHVYWSFICYDETQPGTLVITPVGQAAGLNKVQASGISGFGDQPYHKSGRFYLSVSAPSSCKWQLTVKSA